MFPLCLVFPPVDRHSRLDLSHYYTRFSYYTRHPFYLEADVGKKFACRYTRLPFYSLCTTPHPPFDHGYPPDPARLIVIRIGRCTRLSLRYCARAKWRHRASIRASLISLNLNFPDSLDSGGYNAPRPSLSVTNTPSTSSRDLILSGYLRGAMRLLESRAHLVTDTFTRNTHVEIM